MTSSPDILIRRDKLIVLAAVSLVVLAAVFYTLLGVGMSMSSIDMTRMTYSMPDMMMRPASWTPVYALLVFFMWWVMMIAMMLPSATPAILLFTGIVRKRQTDRHPYFAVAWFVLGYLLVWASFSALATLLQWGMQQAGRLSGLMDLVSRPWAAMVLIIAGLYQFTPLKNACLNHCQHPLFFMIHHWRSGSSGALQMGMGHGLYCLGCCWFLMLLLFVGGVMNLFWIAGIALYVAIEKLAGNIAWISRVMGVVLTCSGIWLLAEFYLLS